MGDLFQRAPDPRVSSIAALPSVGQSRAKHSRGKSWIGGHGASAYPRRLSRNLLVDQAAREWPLGTVAAEPSTRRWRTLPPVPARAMPDKGHGHGVPARRRLQPGDHLLCVLPPTLHDQRARRRFHVHRAPPCLSPEPHGRGGPGGRRLTSDHFPWHTAHNLTRTLYPVLYTGPVPAAEATDTSRRKTDTSRRKEGGATQ